MYAKPIAFEIKLNVRDVPMIKIGDDIIERVFESKLLVITLDPSLKFSEHVLNLFQ